MYEVQLTFHLLSGSFFKPEILNQIYRKVRLHIVGLSELTKNIFKNRRSRTRRLVLSEWPNRRACCLCRL